ncbi:hypothetical protein ACUJ63_004782, partial [Salmonella enterica subsp. enterica]
LKGALFLAMLFVNADLLAAVKPHWNGSRYDLTYDGCHCTDKRALNPTIGAVKPFTSSKIGATTTQTMSIQGPIWFASYMNCYVSGATNKCNFKRQADTTGARYIRVSLNYPKATEYGEGWYRLNDYLVVHVPTTWTRTTLGGAELPDYIYSSAGYNMVITYKLTRGIAGGKIQIPNISYSIEIQGCGGSWGGSGTEMENSCNGFPITGSSPSVPVVVPTSCTITPPTALIDFGSISPAEALGKTKKISFNVNCTAVTRVAVGVLSYDYGTNGYTVPTSISKLNVNVSVPNSTPGSAPNTRLIGSGLDNNFELEAKILSSDGKNPPTGSFSSNIVLMVYVE